MLQNKCLLSCTHFRAIQRDEFHVSCLHRVFPSIAFLADLGDVSSISSAAKTVETVLGSLGLNLIINNAGAAARDKIHTVDPEQMMNLFQVNAVGPLMVVQVY